MSRLSFILRTRIGRVAISGAVVFGAMVLLTISSTALFTDVESVTSNTFTTGTIILDASPTTAAFNVPDLRPGEEVTAEQTVANVGTDQLRYAVTSETTEDVLAAQLVLTIRAGVTSCSVTDWDSDGSQLYQGPLGDSTTPGGLAIVGDATTGADLGDRVLNPSTTEPLCFHVRLPEAATAQNATTTAIFSFLAEQTSNN